jgi:hypothetical protein
VQREREREARDAAPGNEDLHRKIVDSAR